MHEDIADPTKVLSEYALGDLFSVSNAGGTAGRTWKVAAAGGEYLLRLRGVRTSSEERLKFDHGLREHLVARGVPTASAVRTKDGKRWVRRHGRIYELYPFITGRQFRMGNETEIANAARALAAFHREAADYRPPLQRKEAVAQYITLGFSGEASDRIDDPHLQKMNMLYVRKLASTANGRKKVDWCIAKVEQSMRIYAGASYKSLTGWTIHGDYTPANLLFSEEGEVIGIFDLDWALPGSRCRDVADGLYFFASMPRRVDSSDIWSLTEAVDFDFGRCTIFLKAYQSVSPLSQREIESVPPAFAGRWFSIRLEGMAKVHRDERFKFFSRDVEKPLLWLDANWADLASRIVFTAL
jgi:Ser/Thr protein kinase RdoA (MazF antagonist)